MNCPLCIDEILDVTHHGGIEIDICPRCCEVWLDRGELEKLAGSKAGGKSSRQAAHRQVGGLSASPAPQAEKAKKPKKKKRRKKSLGSRLGDVLADVLDF